MADVLAPVILHALRVCRGDFDRMMSVTDYCEQCPLLEACNADADATKEGQ